eukprot:PRCOL_00003355-RA
MAASLKTATVHNREYGLWETIRSMKTDETSIFMCFLHAAALATCVLHPLTANGAAWLVGSYVVRMWVVTCGYHRYFSHRSFKTSRWFQAILGAACCMAGQRGPVWWSSMHRHHHKHSDGEEDAHSPRHGFAWSHMGWFMCSDEYNHIRESYVPDWLDQDKFPGEDMAGLPLSDVALKWLDDRHHIFFLGSIPLFYALGGLDGLLWGFVVSTILSNHASYGINSLVHVVGQRRFNSGDDSRNCWWFALLTHGEGWHNNHHAFPSSARQGLRWFEVDFTYYSLLLLEKLGIVWDLKTPTRAAIERKLIVKPSAA